MDLLPQIARIVSDAMPFEELDQFFLERMPSVMPFLVVDVLCDGWNDTAKVRVHLGSLRRVSEKRKSFLRTEDRVGDQIRVGHGIEV
jgi:hypothetical protein